MNSNVMRGAQRFLMILFALALPVAAQDQDLYVNNYLKEASGNVIVSGYPLLTQSGTTLTTAALDPGSVYLVLYDEANQPFSSCTLSSTLSSSFTVQIAPTAISGQPALTITFGVDRRLTVTNNTGYSFGVGSADPNYLAWQLPTFMSDSSFSVVGDTGHSCGTSYANGRLRITTENVPLVLEKNRSGDVNIPIIGSSIEAYALKAGKFTKVNDHTCSLDGLGKVQHLDVTHPRRPDPPTEPYLSLAGIGDWRITVYPQQLEIKPSLWGNNVMFTLSGAGQLECGSGKSLKIIPAGSDVRPQQFAVDWAPGWFESRRYLQLPCVNCTINLVFSH